MTLSLYSIWVSVLAGRYVIFGEHAVKNAANTNQSTNIRCLLDIFILSTFLDNVSGLSTIIPTKVYGFRQKSQCIDIFVNIMLQEKYIIFVTFRRLLPRLLYIMLRVHNAAYA